MPTPQPDADGSIRIAPGGGNAAEQSRRVLALANSLYSRKMYDLAIPEYEIFLILAFSGDSRDAAMFRLAECHRILGNNAAARAGYEKLVMEFQKGEFAGSGAYRLGEYLFGERIYDAAHTQFSTAVREAKEAEVRLTARYFSARSLDYLKRNDEAAAAYREVADTVEKNPYRPHALMGLADLEVRMKRKESGLALYEQLSKTETRPSLVAESSVKAASLAAELGQTEKALQHFDRIVKMSGVPEWKPTALIGAMQLRYQAGDYRGVVETGDGALDQFPKDSLPEILQILAASHRQLGNNLQASRTYDRLLKEFPDAAPAQNARFQRLLSLYAMNDKNVMAEIDDFLGKTTDPKERTQARLLKAEVLFQQKNYAEAGSIYELLLSKELSGDQQADISYKLGWSLAETGSYPAAVAAYSGFLEKHPDHALAATALAQRAMAKQKNKDFDAAIADFDLLISKYPGRSECELALQQKALIYGQQQKYDEMAGAFALLLEKFPKSAAAAQANFWLGWAAFEQKNYKKAVPLLKIARTMDAAQYGERASLRIILAHYYLQDRAEVTREAAEYKGGNIPSEITLWLALGLIENNEYAKAEALLSPLAANPSALPPEAWISLGEARIRLGKFESARVPVQNFLVTARAPATRARALLANASIELGLKNFAACAPLIEETLLLQPEGRLNAEARLVSGDLLLAQSDFDGAARAYMTVAVLTDDPAVTPRALEKAANAYQRANNKPESEKALAELKNRFPDLQKPQE